MNKTTRLKKPQIPELETLYTFDELGGRPKYGGVEMTSETDIPSFQEIMDETHSAVVAEATARDDADEALEAEIQELAGQTSEALENEAETRAAADTALREAVNSEASTRGAADNVLQNQIDAIVASSDVKDIVGTKAELDAYDTSTLGDNDIIKVLQDESQSNATTYYRYAEATDSFTLIGAEGPYYTKGQADALLNNKADKATTYTKTEVDATVSGLETDIAAKQDQLTAGENITIDNNVISAAAGVKKIKTTDPEFNTNVFTMMTNVGGGVVHVVNETNQNVVLSPRIYNASTNGAYDAYIIPNADAVFVSNVSDGTPVGYYQDVLAVGVYSGSGTSLVIRFEKSSGRGYPMLKASDGTWEDGWGLFALSGKAGYNIKQSIGNLANLSTTDKTNLVAAINELVAAAPADFTGTDGTTAGTHGLVPAPATTDAGKFLKADGTWDDAGSPINVVQTTGTSTANVMSQNATTSMVFSDPNTRERVRIGSTQTVQGRSTSVGYQSQGYGQYSTAIGEGARQYGNYGVSIGAESDMTTMQYAGTVALGAYSGRNITAGGMMDISSSDTSYGYNTSKYRLLTGLYDPQADHDAATKGYVDTAIAAAGGAEEISAADWSNLWQ